LMTTSSAPARTLCSSFASLSVGNRRNSYSINSGSMTEKICGFDDWLMHHYDQHQAWDLRIDHAWDHAPVSFQVCSISYSSKGSRGEMHLTLRNSPNKTSFWCCSSSSILTCATQFLVGKYIQKSRKSYINEWLVGCSLDPSGFRIIQKNRQ
jgi:hypothetical protein